MRDLVVVRHQLLLVLRACLTVQRAGGAALRLRAFVISVLLACAVSAVQAQTPGAVDLSFDSGLGLNGGASVVPAGNGKVYAFGSFSTVRGTARNGIARLNADGTADETFNPGTGTTGIGSLVVQADGKLLIGGLFSIYDGTVRNSIARLNDDGTLDTSFDPGTGTNYYIWSMAVQADGKVLIGGAFESYNGTPRVRIARLNSDGSLDASFNPGTGANNIVYSVAAQSDGKVLIGGLFTTYNGTARNSIARLNSNGSLDPSFNQGIGANDTVYSVAVQPDGKVLIGGNFTSYNGTARTRIARLNSNGSLDLSFNPGTGATGPNEPQYVYSVVVQSDGKVLIVGRFTSYNGTLRNYIARLNSDGSLDTSFDPGTGPNGGVGSIAVQPDGKMFIGGGFTSYNGTARATIAWLNSDGSLDPSFDAGGGLDGRVSSIAVRTDGKVFIGGSFTNVNRTARNHIARLNGDGSLDMSFDPGISASAIVIQTDGKVLINGGSAGIARLHSDGSLDTSFDPGTGASGIGSIAMQSDGKVLIGGSFTSYNGTARNHIARLNSDGSLDTSFDPGTGPNGSVLSGLVNCVAVQTDGKVIIGGYFTSYNGTARSRIARLNSDGSLDPSFNPGTGATAFRPYTGVFSVAVQADGQVLISGSFTSYNNSERYGVARLDPDGSLDTSFNPGSGATNLYYSEDRPPLYSLALQADGKVLIGGEFTGWGGASRNSIVRLNSDGTLDPTNFNPAIGWWPGSVYFGGTVIALEADGKVLIGGEFRFYDGTARNYLARAANDSAIQSISVPNPSQLQWLRGGAAPEIGQVTFEYSADDASWAMLGAGTHISGGWELTGLNLSDTGYIRARGRATGGISNGSSSVIEQVYAFSDADSDGLLDSWELTYWPTTNGHKANDDFDGDGVPELLELAFGLDPTVPDAALQPLVIGEGDYLTITITKHAGAKYEVQTAGSLLVGRPDSFSADSTTVLINDPSTLKARDNFQIGSSSDRFLRVKVTAAP